jgi:hypothetical protein
MARKEHRDARWLREIVRMAGAMNPSGTRGYSSEMILQDLASR